MFYFETISGAGTVLKSDLISAEHFFTTRDFILHSGNLTGMEADIKNNRTTLCSYLEVQEGCLYSAKQTHSDNIGVIGEGNNFFEDTDALVSDIKNTAIFLNFADCTPIILYHERKKIGAVVHAGWRGTASEIVKKTVQKLTNLYEINPEELTAAIGPAIGQCCYCIDEDVYYKIRKTLGQDVEILFKKDDLTRKYYTDLKKINYQQLIDSGVIKIDITAYCTSCSNDLFFSYRKENGITARHSAVIKIS